MIDLLKKQRLSSVLGLAFDGNRLEMVVLRRTNGHFQTQQSLSVTLALSPLTGDPELVGREIKNHLEQAGIRERRCAVCLPLSWVMTLQTPLPDLPEADLASFLEIEAERGFPMGSESLMITHSRCDSGKEQHATFLGIPRSNVATLEQALKSAKLQPVSFSIGILALQSPDKEDSLTLSLGANSVELMVSCGHGIAALRCLDGMTEAEGAQQKLDIDVVAREIRITLGQLPNAFQSAIRTLKIFGRGDAARRFVTELTPRAEAMGLRVEAVERCSSSYFGNVMPTESPLTPALALAALHLGGTPQPFEFLPPKVHPWQQLISTRLSSKKLGYIGAGAGSLVLCVLIAFGVQQWKLSSLQTQWKKMEPSVKQDESNRQQIRKFRPWFDESFRTLAILKTLTEAFPQDGYVSAKTFEIRDSSTVSVSGVARDNQAFLKLQDNLRASKGIKGVTFEQLRGQSPIQFTINFQWEGAANAN